MSTENIYSALSQFRSKVKQPTKSANNPFFHSTYVTLEGVMQAVDEATAGTGLSYIQQIKNLKSGEVAVQTVIYHDSGDSIESGWLALKPEKQTPQGYGSSITYAKRYQLAAMFGISSDIDDDGNQASGQQNKTQPQSKPHAQPQSRRKSAPKKDDSTIQNLQKLYQTMLKQIAKELQTTTNAVQATIIQEVGSKQEYVNADQKGKAMLLVKFAEHMRDENKAKA